MCGLLMDATGFDALWFALGVGAVMVAAIYLVGPLFLLGQLRQPVNPRLERLDADGPKLPSRVEDYFTRVERSLKSLGFETLGDSVLHEQVASVSANLRAFLHPETGDSAAAYAFYVQSGTSWAFKHRLVGFETQTDADAVYDTSNTDQISVFPPRPFHFRRRFPKIRNPAHLYQVHRAILERENPSRGRPRRQAAAAGDWLARLRSDMRRELEHAVAAGYFRLDDETEMLTPTVKGAYLMMWKQLWPWKYFLTVRRDREADRLLRELGLKGSV
jgi:hypothetical protein